MCILDGLSGSFGCLLTDSVLLFLKVKLSLLLHCTLYTIDLYASVLRHCRLGDSMDARPAVILQI